MKINLSNRFDILIQTCLIVIRIWIERVSLCDVGLHIYPAVLCPFHPPDHFLYVWCLQSVREQDVRALILVPTKELGQQVQTMIRQLTAYCLRDVRVADISGKADLSAQRSVCSGTSVTHLYIYILLIKNSFCQVVLMHLYKYMFLHHHCIRRMYLSEFILL